MEKISGIIPSNSRLKSVDLKESHPVRPGTPTAGRPVGRNSVKDRFTLSSDAKDIALRDTLVYKNPKEAARAQIAEQVTDRFFETRLEQPTEVESFTTEQLAEDLSEAEPTVTETLDLELPENTEKTDFSRAEFKF